MNPVLMSDLPLLAEDLQQNFLREYKLFVEEGVINGVAFQVKPEVIPFDAFKNQLVEDVESAEPILAFRSDQDITKFVRLWERSVTDLSQNHHLSYLEKVQLASRLDASELKDQLSGLIQSLVSERENQEKIFETTVSLTMSPQVQHQLWAVHMFLDQKIAQLTRFANDAVAGGPSYFTYLSIASQSPMVFLGIDHFTTVADLVDKTTRLGWLTKDDVFYSVADLERKYERYRQEIINHYIDGFPKAIEIPTLTSLSKAQHNELFGLPVGVNWVTNKIQLINGIEQTPAEVHMADLLEHDVYYNHSNLMQFMSYYSTGGLSDSFALLRTVFQENTKIAQLRSALSGDTLKIADALIYDHEHFFNPTDVATHFPGPYQWSFAGLRETLKRIWKDEALSKKVLQDYNKTASQPLEMPMFRRTLDQMIDYSDAIATGVGISVTGGPPPVPFSPQRGSL